MRHKIVTRLVFVIAGLLATAGLVFVAAVG